MTLPTRTIFLTILASLVLTVSHTVAFAQASDPSPTTDAQPPATDTAPADIQPADAPEEQAQGADNRRPRRLQDATNTGEEWVPGQGVDTERSLRRKLTLADQAFQQGNLTVPVNASALKFYQDALEIDPENQAAQTGITQIANRLIERALTLNSAGDRAGAQDLLAVARNLRPGSAGLADADAEISQQAEINAGLTAGASAVEAGELPAALEAYRSVLSIDEANEAAQTGIASVLQAWADRVNTAIADENLEQAQEHAEALAAIDANHPALEQLDAAQDEAEAARREQLLIGAQQAFDVGNLDIAEQRLSAYEAAGGEGGDTLRRAIERQRRLAQYPAGSEFRDNEQAPLMIVVPAGRFELGSPDSEQGRYGNEGPLQTISLDAPFGLAQTEVTVGQFRQFVNATSYTTDAERAGESSIYSLQEGQLLKQAGVNWRNDYSGDVADDGLPVVHVSHNDASAYTEWLSEETDQSYRLPSEAEFEYALRAGSSTPYWWGDERPAPRSENLAGENDSVGEWSWRDQGFSGYRDGSWGPAPVGTFQANPFGLFDMGGNVLEWVADCYESNLEATDSNGTARVTAGCSRFVIKGGSWASSPRRSRSAQRTPGGAVQVTCLLGFRVARDL